MPDWDARAYHRLSGPQLSWGRRVLERLAPRRGERILDLGCGTGRLTTEAAAQVPGLRLIGLDVSQAMLSEARATTAGVVSYVRASGLALPFAPASFDAVFSAATFHWIPDHRTLFAEIHAVLEPGGRLVAQCGGGPNLKKLLDRTHALMDSREYRSFFRHWRDPWYFAATGQTRATLTAVGFFDADVSLEAAPTTLADAATYADFIACVCVRHHVDRLPLEKRRVFISQLAALAATDDPPFTLDYWRLNISARKGQPG